MMPGVCTGAIEMRIRTRCLCTCAEDAISPWSNCCNHSSIVRNPGKEVFHFASWAIDLPHSFIPRIKVMLLAPEQWRVWRRKCAGLGLCGSLD